LLSRVIGICPSHSTGDYPPFSAGRIGSVGGPASITGSRPRCPSASMPPAAYFFWLLKRTGGLTLINCVDLRSLTRPRNGAGEHVRGRRSTEKRAQDARASDGAPIGASVTAIVAGCGAADTLGLPLGQVRVLHGSTPFLDEGYGAFASRSTVLGGSAVRRCSAGRRCSRRRMPCSPRSAPPPVRGWAVPMIRRTRSASSAALSGRTSFCCPRRSPAAGVGACFRCSSSGMLRPLPSASQRASARLARAFP
jgi:Molybdopterin-binding domain of aldehyde dehydrogenase